MRIASPKHWRCGWAMVAATLLGWATLRSLPPDRGGGRWYPGCYVHRVTGLYCAGCGTTRCASALARGDVRQAAAYNVLFLTMALPAWVAWVSDTVWRGRTGRGLIPWRRLARWLAPVALVLVLGFTVWRNLPVAGGPLLAPHRLAGSSAASP
jgi:hypothetical protein